MRLARLARLARLGPPPAPAPGPAVCPAVRRTPRSCTSSGGTAGGGGHQTSWVSPPGRGSGSPTSAGGSRCPTPSPPPANVNEDHIEPPPAHRTLLLNSSESKSCGKFTQNLLYNPSVTKIKYCYNFARDISYLCRFLFLMKIIIN